MKQIILTALVAFSFIKASAQPPAGDAKPGDWYGEKIHTENAIDIAQIPAKLNEKESFNTKVKAKVLDVCPKKGCWLKLAVNDSTTAFVKMKDYGFFLPVAVKGKTIVMDGEVKMLTTSVDELQHYAKDAKKSQAEINAITQPKKEIRFTATGITVVE
ncbi:DUF4920 domain-containing protein [Niastella populi]|uniref:DUF4920 domain-containing protein n=1 Tax=Niastella populi TaxID=550983 RepID=A0A1V9G1S5_9BACT|nr:DUF4920 domain-containing protein [Niastella populi]OQP64595.1 DUF4920 domain-containing protein [Niastella populi]